MFRFSARRCGNTAAESIKPESARHRRHFAVDNQRLDRQRSRRRQEIAVAMMTGRDYEARNSRRAKNRGIVDRTRPQPAPYRLDRHLLDYREGATCAFEQRIKAARRNGVVEAALLDGRADDDPAVALRSHVDLLGPDDVGKRAGVWRRLHCKRLAL